MDAVHATVNRSVQFAQEGSPGAGGTANLVEPNLTLDLVPAWASTEYGLGQWVSRVVKGLEAAQGESSMPAGFSNMLLPLLSAIRKVSPSVGADGDSQIWTILAPSRGSAVVQTYTFEIGDGEPGVAGGLNHKYNHGYWNGFTLTSTQTECTITGPVRAMWEQQLGTMSTLAASPGPEMENVLIDPNDIDLFYSLTSMADLEASPVQILNNFDYTLAITGRYGEYSHQKSTNNTFEGIVPIRPDAGITLTQSARSNVGRTDYNEPFTMALARKNQKMWLRWQAIGPLIADATPDVFYLAQIDACVQVREPYGRPDVNGVLGKTAGLRIVSDGVAGFPIRFKLVNLTTGNLLVAA